MVNYAGKDIIPLKLTVNIFGEDIELIMYSSTLVNSLLSTLQEMTSIEKNEIKKEYNYLSFTFTTNQNGTQPRNQNGNQNGNTTSQSKWQTILQY